MSLRIEWYRSGSWTRLVVCGHGRAGPRIADGLNAAMSIVVKGVTVVGLERYDGGGGALTLDVEGINEDADAAGAAAASKVAEKLTEFLGRPVFSMPADVQTADMKRRARIAEGHAAVKRLRDERAR